MVDIHPSLEDSAVFEPQVTHAMLVAYHEICRIMNIPAGASARRNAIAAQIIELAKRGEQDKDLLREGVLRQAQRSPTRIPA